MASNALESAGTLGGLVAAGVLAAHLRHRPLLSLGAIARGVVVGVFGALPATMLLVPTLALGFNAADSLQYGRDTAFYTAATMWAVLALLGTVGLWLASVQPPAASTLALIACGLLADGVVIVDGLMTDPTWFAPRRLDREAMELALLLAPFVVGTAYMASMVRERRVVVPAPDTAAVAAGASVVGEAAEAVDAVAAVAQEHFTYPAPEPQQSVAYSWGGSSDGPSGIE